MLTAYSLILKNENGVTRKRAGTWPPALYLHHCRRWIPTSTLESSCHRTRHIQSLCSKARKLIGLIYCRFYQHSSPKSLLQMYLTLVRPHLEYASQVWNTSKIGEIDSFEKVQKFTLRVYSKQWNSGYDELLQLFSLPTLQQCRLYLHLSIMWIVYSLSYFPSGMFVKQTWRVTRSQFHQLYVCPYTHININQYCNSFVPRIIRNWN